MKINLEGKTFRSVANTDNGEVGSETVFKYSQEGDVVTATYAGGEIVFGQVLGRMNAEGVINLRYHHLNDSGDFMLGKCVSTPEILDDGRIKYLEKWRWLSGDQSEGQSEIIEVVDE